MVPLLIGWVINDFATQYDKAGSVIGYNYSVPMAVFAVFGLCAIFVALLLRVEDNKKHYGLEDANIKK